MALNQNFAPRPKCPATNRVWPYAYKCKVKTNDSHPVHPTHLVHKRFAKVPPGNNTASQAGTPFVRRYERDLVPILPR